MADSESDSFVGVPVFPTQSSDVLRHRSEHRTCTADLFCRKRQHLFEPTGEVFRTMGALRVALETYLYGGGWGTLERVLLLGGWLEEISIFVTAGLLVGCKQELSDLGCVQGHYSKLTPLQFRCLSRRDC